MGDAGPLGVLGGLGLGLAGAAMKAIRLSRTAFWTGPGVASIVAPTAVDSATGIRTVDSAGRRAAGRSRV